MFLQAFTSGTKCCRMFGCTFFCRCAPEAHQGSLGAPAVLAPLPLLPKPPPVPPPPSLALASSDDWQSPQDTTQQHWAAEPAYDDYEEEMPPAPKPPAAPAGWSLTTPPARLKASHVPPRPKAGPAGEGLKTFLVEGKPPPKKTVAMVTSHLQL